jgi:Rha family phage regulatory protein
MGDSNSPVFRVFRFWFKYQVENLRLIQGEDYSELTLKFSENSDIKRKRGRPAKDYALTFKIAMTINPDSNFQIIAEKVNKSHKNVLQAIAKLSYDQEFMRLNFEPSDYIDARGKVQSMYYITKDGFSFFGWYIKAVLNLFKLFKGYPV